MFNTESITDTITENAQKICMPRSIEALKELQLSYWLCVQNIMNEGGYSELKKRMPNISESLAESIKAASIPDLMKLCSSEVCTVEPSIEDALIGELMIPNSSAGQAKVASKMALQLISTSMAA